MGLPLWIFVAFGLFIALAIVFRTMNQVYLLSLIKKHTFWIFAIAVFIFLAISLVSIHSTYDIDFSTSEGISTTFKIYFSWMKNVFSNMGKVTGYVFQQDWTSANYTG